MLPAACCRRASSRRRLLRLHDRLLAGEDPARGQEVVVVACGPAPAKLTTARAHADARGLELRPAELLALAELQDVDERSGRGRARRAWPDSAGKRISPSKIGLRIVLAAIRSARARPRPSRVAWRSRLCANAIWTASLRGQLPVQHRGDLGVVGRLTGSRDSHSTGCCVSSMTVRRTSANPESLGTDAHAASVSAATATAASVLASVIRCSPWVLARAEARVGPGGRVSRAPAKPADPKADAVGRAIASSRSPAGAREWPTESRAWRASGGRHRWRASARGPRSSGVRVASPAPPVQGRGRHPPAGRCRGSSCGRPPSRWPWPPRAPPLRPTWEPGRRADRAGVSWPVPQGRPSGTALGKGSRQGSVLHCRHGARAGHGRVVHPGHGSRTGGTCLRRRVLHVPRGRGSARLRRLRRPHARHRVRAGFRHTGVVHGGRTLRHAGCAARRHPAHSAVIHLVGPRCSRGLAGMDIFE